MLSSVHEYAPAKLNFNLKVLPKRADGFHDIESIFQTISLCDELLVEIGQSLESQKEPDGREEMVEKNYGSSDSPRCIVTSPDLSLPSSNTLTKAYDAFCSLTGWSESVHVTLTKHIPSGGGLGGGSSDAAAMIRALEKLSGITLSQEQLFQAASQIGSDVFFFLLNRKPHFAALVTGRGEKVEYFEPRKDIYYVLICPPVHSSTPEAYRLVDQWKSGNTIGYPMLADLVSMYNGPVEKWEFNNSFTRPLASTYPEIEHALQNLLDTHALYAEMSGSGSVVFGVYGTYEHARNAATQLLSVWNTVHLVQPVQD